MVYIIHEGVKFTHLSVMVIQITDNSTNSAKVRQWMLHMPGFRPTKDKSHGIIQISWHESHDTGFPSHKANLMTFCVWCHDTGGWHSNKRYLVVKIKESNHNTCVVYLFNWIGRHIYPIEMFLVCLKINMKHPTNVDVETCRVRPVTSQWMKSLFPAAAMCAPTDLLSIGRLWAK